MTNKTTPEKMLQLYKTGFKSISALRGASFSPVPPKLHCFDFCWELDLNDCLLLQVIPDHHWNANKKEKYKQWIKLAQSGPEYAAWHEQDGLTIINSLTFCLEWPLLLWANITANSTDGVHSMSDAADWNSTKKLLKSSTLLTEEDKTYLCWLGTWVSFLLPLVLNSYT